MSLGNVSSTSVLLHCEVLTKVRSVGSHRYPEEEAVDHLFQFDGFGADDHEVNERERDLSHRGKTDSMTQYK